MGSLINSLTMVVGRFNRFN